MQNLILAAAALAAASPAAAQDDPDDAPLGISAGLDLSGEIRLLSDYRFRGVSRSDEDPALQAALTASHESGFYAGVRATTLQGIDSFRLRNPAFRDLGDVELDLYAGYGARLGGGFDLDAGLLHYVFAGADGATDHVEPYASLSYLIGPVYATAGAKYAPAQRATGDEDMLYLFGQIDVSVPFRPWSFTALIGHQNWGTGRCGLPPSPQPCPEGLAAIPFGSYLTWSLGVEHQLRIAGLPGAEIGLSYVDTDLPSRAGQDAGLVLSLGLVF